MEQEIRPLTPNEILRGWLDSLPRKDYNKTKHLLVDACLVPLHTVNNWVYGNCSIRPVDILNKLTPYGLFKLTPIDNL